jgi:hypothetical protein
MYLSSQSLPLSPYGLVLLVLALRTSNNVLHLRGLDARLVNTLLEHLVQQAVGRRVAEPALLGASERCAASVLGC